MAAAFFFSSAVGSAGGGGRAGFSSATGAGAGGSGAGATGGAGGSEPHAGAKAETRARPRAVSRSARFMRRYVPRSPATFKLRKASKRLAAIRDDRYAGGQNATRRAVTA